MKQHDFCSHKFGFCFILTCLVLLLSVSNALSEGIKIEHPFKTPQKYTDKAKCDNCGMDRNKWARTRYEFQTSKGRHYTCSIHCASVISSKYKEAPQEVMVAEYLHPENLLQAEKVFFVIGSSAPGTMTARSKLAFPTKEEAVRFSSNYGGDISDFKGALSEARKGYR